MSDQFLWTEKYRPATIEDAVLPEELKATFQQFVDQRNVPNLLLSGPSGVGKTTVARAILEQLGCDYIVINGSMNGNIDTLRNDIQSFASSVSFAGGRKYVILDEADYLNPNSTQPALRNFMEEFASNCGFILTCNYKNRIIPALQSRCSVIDFKINKNMAAKLASGFFGRVQTILEKENVPADQAVVAEVVKKYYPDWRRVLNELQRYAATGRIDSGIMVNLKETSLKSLVTLLKEKNYTEVRQWVKDNMDSDVADLFNQFYTISSDVCTPQTAPQLVLLLSRYQYQNAFVANPEINLLAFLVEVMMECEFV